MISIVGIGNAACTIAEKFADQGNYETYYLGSTTTKKAKHAFQLKEFDKPEEYENNIPDLKDFFKSVRQRVQVFIVGASYSSNYALGILEQLKEREIDLFYIKPDIEMLTGTPRLVENVTFGVLQEYARSGLFRTLTLIANPNLESMLGEVPIKNYYNILNDSIFSTIHYLNYFEFTDPEIGQVAHPAAINRIRSIAMLDIETLEEKWLFNLDMPRELCYYICINDEKIGVRGRLAQETS